MKGNHFERETRELLMLARHVLNNYREASGGLGDPKGQWPEFEESAEKLIGVIEKGRRARKKS